MHRQAKNEERSLCSRPGQKRVAQTLSFGIARFKSLPAHLLQGPLDRPSARAHPKRRDQNPGAVKALLAVHEYRAAL